MLQCCFIPLFSFHPAVLQTGGLKVRGLRGLRLPRFSLHLLHPDHHCATVSRHSETLQSRIWEILNPSSLRLNVSALPIQIVVIKKWDESHLSPHRHFCHYCHFTNSRPNRCQNQPCVPFMLTPASTTLSNVHYRKSHKTRTCNNSDRI